MSRKSLLFQCLSTVCIILILAACSGKPAATPTPAGNPTTSGDATPIAQPTSTTPVPPITVGGPGPFNLPQPGAQRDLLSRYQAELRVHFNGEQEGKPVERSTHLTLVYAGPEAQVTRLETSNTVGEAPIFLLAGQVGETRFLQADSAMPCSSMADEEDPETPVFGDPWAELPAVYGAELAGFETVNGFETEHYTFDQRAIRWAAGATAQGDLWVAKGGGFLVRYRLIMQAPAGVLSAVSDGEQRWEFDLTPLEEGVELLPEGCAPVLSDFILLPDAAKTLRLPGYLSYITSSELEAAAQLYRQELTAAGWQEQDAFNATTTRTLLFFVRPLPEDETTPMQEIATITLRPAPAGLKVEVQVLRIETPAEEGG